MIPEGLLLGAGTEAPANPFPGLRPFEFGESHLYFGRDGQSDGLIRRLSATRFVAVVGTSGSGKSSLVRAGLLPDLFGGYMAAAGSNWRVAVLRPGNDPLGNLARALNDPSVFGSEIEENAQIQAAITEATLRRGGLGLVESVRQNRRPTNENLLVLVDQFEELFRFARVSGGEQYRYEAAAFVKLLLEAARQREQNVYVVLTMRSDFLGDCSMFWDLPEAINEGQYLIPRMSRDQRAEAVTGPVAVCGGRITQRLVNRLLNDTGDNPDLLPILQHALMRTWECWKDDHAEGEPIDLRHYEAVGTMSDALSRHADEAWGELPDERSRQIAEKVFKALTEKGEDNREVRRPTELSKLCTLTGATPSEVAAVLEVFRREGRSFLMPPASVPLDANTPVDISHESLIRNWQRLKTWVDEESVSAQIYRRLAETAVLHERGEAGLWRDPDLQLALDWRSRSGPNAAWAVRYHPAFDSAMSFLDASVAARDAAALEEERRRQREIKRARVTAVFFFFLFMLALLAFGVAYNKSIQAQEALSRVEEANQQANEARARAEGERDRANEQTARAVRSEHAANDARNEALEKQEEAEESRAEAERQAELARSNAAAAEAATVEARTQQGKAEAAAERNLQMLYAASLNLAQQAYDAGHVTRSRSLLDELAPDPARGLRPGFEWFYLWGRNHAEAATIKTPQGVVSGLAYSPDGRLLASAGNDGTLSLWDASSKNLLASLPGHTGGIRGLAFSPDGRVLATTGRDASVRLWDVAARRELAPPFEKFEREVTAIAFSPDGKTLATGGRTGDLRLWDVATRKMLLMRGGHASAINAVAFSPDGKLIGSAGADGRAALWDVSSEGLGEFLLEQGGAGSVLSAAFSPDGLLFATGSARGTVSLWDVVRRQAVYVLEGHSGPVNSIRFSADGRRLVSGGSDKAVVVWGLPESYSGPRPEVGKVTLKGHTADVWSVAFSPDGKTLVSGAGDGSIKLWDVESQLREELPLRHDANVRSVVVSPDGRVVATGSGRVVKLWDAATRRELKVFEGGEQTVWSVAFSPDGRVMAAAGQDKTVRLLDAATGRRLPPDLAGHGGTVTSVAYSPDGRLIATAGRDSVVKLWDAATHREVASLGGYEKPVMCVAFSKDGRLLATGAGDGSLVVWDVGSRAKLYAGKEHGSAVNSVAFSPDGRLLATASDDQTVRVWEARSFKQLARLADHPDKVRAVAFSPDGRTLATGGDDHDVMLWETRLFNRVVTLKGHTNSVSSLSFTPDGRTLLSASFDATVRVWRAASDAEVLSAR